MLYKELCEYYERLESITKNLEKRDIVCELLESAKKEELEELTLLSMGRAFSASEGKEKDMGIAGKLMLDIIHSSFGIEKEKVEEKYREKGDLGKTAEYFSKHKRQVTLSQEELSVKKVYANLRKLPELKGEGSQGRKSNLVKELLVSSAPKEARYIVRTILGEMRIGVGEGTVRDAISKTFNVSKGKVERAFNILTNYGKVARISKEEGEKGLEEVEITVGKPIKSMEAIKETDLETVLEDKDKPVEIEEKYDGYKIQVHLKGENIKLFTRRLEEVTQAFPEIVEFTKECIKADNCIVEGECMAVDPKTGRPRPFQYISRRIQRKYDIEKIKKKIPVVLKLYDALLINGETLIDRPFKERRKKLEKIVEEKEGKITLSKRIITSEIEEARNFYQKSVENGFEGVMIKNLEAEYKPGRREGYQYKLKPTLEPLDVVITGAIWGKGRRSGWLGSYYLACRDPETGNLLRIGKMATGLTDKQLELMTKKLKPLIIEEKNDHVKIKPKIVIEVEYEEIQKSPNYKSGFGLRFPRLRRFREDKGVEDVDTIERLKKIYKQQEEVNK